MPGATDLKAVLPSLDVDCDDLKYGFACVSNTVQLDQRRLLATFQETEGLTVLSTQTNLESSGLNFEGPYAKLTVTLQTSLELVGLTAALSTALADEGISANVIAAFHHDHIFVPYDARHQAIQVIEGLAEAAASQA